MGKSAALFSVFLFSQSVALSAAAAISTIEPGEFANGANISTLIPGVTLSEAAASLDTAGPVITVPLHLVSDFSGPVFASGSVFANSGGPIWSAGPCCTIHNALRADFADKVIRVAVEFLPDDNDGGVLQAYSASGALLDDKLLIANHPFTLEIFSASTPIAYLLASFGDTGLIGAITFETSPIPLPSGFGLMACGMLVVASSARKRRKMRAS